MYQLGDFVRIKHPFNVPFSEVYIVEQIEVVDGINVYYLTDANGAYSADWLEGL
jgi:hypothetical protein